MLFYCLRAKFQAIVLGLACCVTILGQVSAQEAVKSGGSPRAGRLPILVVDKDDKPISDVKIVPWALGSGQGHGSWGPFEGKPDESGMEPESVVTDAHGLAIVRYPIYRNAAEKTRTRLVSIRLEHAEYSSSSSEHVSVSAGDEPHKITLQAAATIILAPRIDEQPVALEGLYALWSNSRSWQAGNEPERIESGKLKIGGFEAGNNTVLLIRMIDEKITHFSKIKNLELVEGSETESAIPLLPAIRVSGRLSDNVPRPVRDGRVVAHTIPSSSNSSGIGWTDWAPIAADGSFVIESWPRGESIQLIALCDGFIASSGEAPSKELEFERDPYHRPQTFETSLGELVVPMIALTPVSVTAVDSQNNPVNGLDVATAPNVGWWNMGSQIYGKGLVQGKNLMRKREYTKVVEDPYPSMFRGLTDSRGRVTLQLPAGLRRFGLLSDQYELPVNLGEREERVSVEEGKPLEVSLQVQPSGTERLGDWDKLAGVVYGCSTDEGRRLLALPGMEERLDEFVKQFSEAKNQEDPALLADAYKTLSDAFSSADDKKEALKWRRKADELLKK